ncbi:hypothetical protein PAPYR_10955 [Paratrimastix pyriformis]|uniref:Uncharacterized protein n=1 Tax=Paratrimastix pyriformis TaxID=342808 RepID=A0ABQ8U8N3_9EUKA|nr:hypothetical protein PAPYR_10955 [Paratrimastix pyriformis]
MSTLDYGGLPSTPFSNNIAKSSSKKGKSCWTIVFGCILLVLALGQGFFAFWDVWYDWSTKLDTANVLVEITKIFNTHAFVCFSFWLTAAFIVWSLRATQVGYDI